MERTLTWLILIVAALFAINTVVCGPHALLNEDGYYWLLGSQLAIVAACIYELMEQLLKGVWQNASNGICKPVNERNRLESLRNPEVSQNTRPEAGLNLYQSFFLTGIW